MLINLAMRTHTHTHADSLLQTPAHTNSPALLLQTNFPCQLPPESTITSTRLSTFSPFNPADSKTRTHFSSTFDGIELLLWVISVTLQGQVEKCSPSQSLSVSNILPLSPEDTCAHKQIACYINTCCHFANCFDVHYCVLTVTVSNTAISKMQKV